MRIDSKVFKNVISIADKIIKSCPSSHILPVKLEAEKGFLRISATNLGETFIKTIPVISKEEFCVCVKISDLKKVGKTIKKEFDLTYETEGDYPMLVFKEKNVVKIVADSDVEEHFPNPEYMSGEISDSKKVGIPFYKEDVFFELIQKICFSTTTKNINSSYAGILFDSEHNNIVSSDIYRLSVVDMKDLEIPMEIVVPAEFLSFMIKKKSGEFNEMLCSSDHTLFRFSDETWICNNIKPEFPNYMSVVGNDFDKVEPLVIDRHYFEDRMKDMAGLFGKDITAVTTFGNDSISFQARDKDGTEMTSEIPFVNPMNPEVRRGYMIQYLLEGIKSFDVNPVEIVFGVEKLQPLVLKERKNDYVYLHMIMPCRI